MPATHHSHLVIEEYEYPSVYFNISQYHSSEHIAQEDQAKIDMYYRLKFLPEVGDFPGAHWDVTVALNEHFQGINPEINWESATIEGEAELISATDRQLDFDLSLPNDKQGIARIRTPPNMLPDHMSKEGDTCYITLQLEYNHGLTKSVHDWSDEDVQRRRRKYREAHNHDERKQRDT